MQSLRPWNLHRNRGAHSNLERWSDQRGLGSKYDLCASSFATNAAIALSCRVKDLRLYARGRGADKCRTRSVMEFVGRI